MNYFDILYSKMMKYYAKDPKRAQHFIKVHSFSAVIGRSEGLDDVTQETLEVAALVHDIGIKVAEEKYGKCTGKLQETEGPAVAEVMLKEIGYPENLIERVCYLVGHHHTYTNVVGMDYQILLEADFLVNMYEDEMSEKAITAALKNVFKTEKGIELCKAMFCA